MGSQKQRADSAVAFANHKSKDAQSVEDFAVLPGLVRLPQKKPIQSQKTRRAQHQQWLLLNPLAIIPNASPGVIQASIPTRPRIISPACMFDDFSLPKSRIVSIARPSLPIAESLFQSMGTIIDRTASQPPTSGACPFLDRSPNEIHHLFLSYLFDGAVVLDKGWLLDDYRANKGMNPRNLPVLWRVSKPAFPGQSTARIEPVSSRANTSIMFTCKRLLEVYAPQIYGRSAFAISLPQTARRWLLPWNSGSSRLRRLHSPCPWITTLHIHVPVYGAPRFRSDIKHQAQYYLGWRKTMASIAEECTNLKEVHISLDVPRKLPFKVDLRQDWAWCLLPLAWCKSLDICQVELNMDWHSDMIGAFEEYLTIILKGGDRADGVAALKSARTQALCTREGMSFIDEWNDFVQWNEQERRLIEAAKEWQLINPPRSQPLPSHLPHRPWKRL